MLGTLNVRSHNFLLRCAPLFYHPTSSVRRYQPDHYQPRLPRTVRFIPRGKMGPVLSSAGDDRPTDRMDLTAHRPPAQIFCTSGSAKPEPPSSNTLPRLLARGLGWPVCAGPGRRTAAAPGRSVTDTVSSSPWLPALATRFMTLRFGGCTRSWHYSARRFQRDWSGPSLRLGPGGRTLPFLWHQAMRRRTLIRATAIGIGCYTALTQPAIGRRAIGGLPIYFALGTPFRTSPHHCERRRREPRCFFANYPFSTCAPHRPGLPTRPVS